MYRACNREAEYNPDYNMEDRPYPIANGICCPKESAKAESRDGANY